MISIFNGRQRTLGGGGTSVFAQIDVGFREVLHLLKGAKLAVFMAIALHSNEDGWAWPSYDTLSRETGYNQHTIATALADLCKLRIGGHRVLLRFQPVGEDGQFMSNRYLIFPSAEECAQYHKPEPTPTPEPEAQEPHAQNLHAEKPQTENLPSNQIPCENHNQTKEVGGGINSENDGKPTQIPLPAEAYYNVAVNDTLTNDYHISPQKARQISEIPGIDLDIVERWADHVGGWYPGDDSESAKQKRRGGLVRRLLAGEAPPEADRDREDDDTAYYAALNAQYEQRIPATTA